MSRCGSCTPPTPGRSPTAPGSPRTQTLFDGLQVEGGRRRSSAPKCARAGLPRRRLDEEHNSTVGGDGAIRGAQPHVDVRVIHTDEERVIAQMTGQVLGLGLTHTKETSP